MRGEATERGGGTEDLRELWRRGEYGPLIDLARDLVTADRRALTDLELKAWCGRRWRDIFVSEAVTSRGAVGAATRRVAIPGTDIAIPAGRDQRPARQKIAERFLLRPGSEWRNPLPVAETPRLEATLVLCPGLINSMLPMRAFAAAFAAVDRRYGWKMIAADAHPMRSCEANVADLAAAIEQRRGFGPDYLPIDAETAEPSEDVFLLCYSKGAPDALTLLVERPDLAPRVRAVFNWAGAVGGSYLADDVYARIKDLDIPVGSMSGPLKLIAKTFLPVAGFEGAVERLEEYDVKGAIRDLTTTERERFLAAHSEQLHALGVPFFNITGATTPAEVPYFQIQGARTLSRHDRDNDMQVTQDQARLRIPMATDLAVLRAHHWDLSYDPFPVHTRMGAAKLNHPFPREAALTAIFKFAAELGLIE